jgi:hypothetical protein
MTTSSVATRHHSFSWKKTKMMMSSVVAHQEITMTSNVAVRYH